MNNNRGIVDKFLDGYDNYNDKKKQTQLVTVYVRPSKFKSIVGFIFCSLLFILLITMFSFNLIYFITLFVTLGVAIYYGINLFTPNGIGMPKTIEVPVDELVNEASEVNEDYEEEFEQKSDRYKV